MAKTALLLLSLGMSMVTGCATAPQFATAPPGKVAPTATKNINYTDYAQVLRMYVNTSGLVDYEKLQANPQQLNQFVERIGAVTPDIYSGWKQPDQLAFLLNAYNALTLHSIIAQKPLKGSIKDIFGVWNINTHLVIGELITLDTIEHKILRPKFNEPRIHAALVCAAKSCPPLRPEPYEGEKLEAQLNDQVQQWLATQGLKIDRQANEVSLSAIFNWFGEDWQPKYAATTQFTGNQKERAVLNFISQYVSPSDGEFLEKGGYKVTYLPYDWSLNRQ